MPVVMPSSSDAGEGYKWALENARRHLNCGELLSRVGENGAAAAHMVLSAEESIKAQVLMIINLDANVPLDKFKPLLTSHSPRLLAGAFSTVMQYFISQWIGLITSLDEQHSDRTSDDYQKDRQKKTGELLDHLDQVNYAGPGESDFIDELDWWNNSNDLKQRGLYVDFNENVWLEPSSVSQEEFNVAHKIAQKVLLTSEQMADSFRLLPPAQRQELVRLIENYWSDRQKQRKSRNR